MTIIRINPIPIMLLLAAVILLGVILRGVILPPLNAHALNRHEGTAIRAHSHVEQNGNDDCKLHCVDGRVRYVCPVDRPGKPLFAIVVLSPVGDLITAFMCREAYADGVRAMEKK